MSRLIVPVQTVWGSLPEQACSTFIAASLHASYGSASFRIYAEIRAALKYRFAIVAIVARYLIFVVEDVKLRVILFCVARWTR